MHSLLDSEEDRTDLLPALSTQSGRVRFGVRGNAIWEWKNETGGYSTDINTQRLQKLQATNLEIEKTGRFRKPSDASIELTLAEEAESTEAFNPYQHSKKHNLDPYQARVKISVPPPKQNPKPERRPIKDLKAYGEWLEMKRRLAENKDDDDILIG